MSSIRARDTHASVKKFGVLWENEQHFDYDWGARMVSQRYTYVHTHTNTNACMNWGRKGANTARWCQFSWQKSLKIEWKPLYITCTSIYESRESFAYSVYLPVYMPTECRDNGLLSKSICVHIMCPQNYSLLEWVNVLLFSHFILTFFVLFFFTTKMYVCASVI